jgi:DNA invertase Pin-like site-specific DNA recombinase
MMMVAAKTKAFGYLRVSSVGQASTDRDGLKRQREAIQKYAEANNVKIVRWFTDTLTGSTDLENRPALFDLMKSLEANGVRLVLVERLDRLARDLMIQESILRDVQRKEAQLISVSEPDLCGNEPTRVMIRQILGAFFEYERKAIVSKLKGARQRAKASRPDYREGRKPFGTRPGEPETIKEILRLRSKGMAWDTIAETLNGNQKFPARKGQWHATSVARVWQREASDSRTSHASAGR